MPSTLRVVGVTLALTLLPASASASPNAVQCGGSLNWNGTCFHNPDHVLHHLETADAGECCGNCSATEMCKSWTFWTGNNCNLFHTIGEPESGEQCVSGDGSDAPPTPPKPHSPWVPPPPHGPVCKDCPNIIFSLTDDQDVQLGGWDGPMTQTKALIQHDVNGAFLSEWRIHTPICSVSRGSCVDVFRC